MRDNNAGNTSGEDFSSDLLDKLPEEDRALSAKLVDARLDTRVLEEFPGQLPTSMG